MAELQSIQEAEKDRGLEEYLLLLLSDSNLPSGGFIASSGLESYVQHGFLPSDDAATKTTSILDFTRKSLHSYAALNLPFLASTHGAVERLRRRHLGSREHVEITPQKVLEEVKGLDALYESMVLNHVARRASAAQGVALLTLYERAFSNEHDEHEAGCRQLVDLLRSDVRKGESCGHLVVGFAVLTASLGLSMAASQHLFLFLHARSLLSSAIRMNIIGPYVSHRLLLHSIRPLVNSVLSIYRSQPSSNTLVPPFATRLDQLGALDKCEENGPATTWPLGEILATRHDQLHSKIFNS